MNFFSLFKRRILYKIKKKINIDLQVANNDSLDKLLNFYGSDKANIFRKTGLQGHGFSNFYSKELNNFKNKKIKILEVGSFSGASAAAFSKYFSNSTIYCFDINISNFIYSSKDINVFGLDIKNEKKLEKTINEISLLTKNNFFDIIIDDGSHYLSDILCSLKILFKHLRKGGVYIIEDFMYPNYYNYNKDVEDIYVDQMLHSLKNNKIFNSNIIKPQDQKILQNHIEKISIHKGNLKDSDICFIEKKI